MRKWARFAVEQAYESDIWFSRLSWSVTADGGMIAAGPRLRWITDAGSKGLAGVNRGTTGEESAVRRRLPPPDAGERA